MKRLFETADLEAELFGEGQPDTFVEEEYDISEEMAEEMVVLEEFSEEDLDDFPALELTLELSDGRSLEYEVAGVFLHEDREYMALHPKTDTDGVIHIMRLTQGEDDEINLMPVEDEAEFAAVTEAFYQQFGDEEI